MKECHRRGTPTLLLSDSSPNAIARVYVILTGFVVSTRRVVDTCCGHYRLLAN